jgi:hypothetical protein
MTSLIHDARSAGAAAAAEAAEAVAADADPSAAVCFLLRCFEGGGADMVGGVRKGNLRQTSMRRESVSAPSGICMLRGAAKYVTPLWELSQRELD